MEQLAAIFTIFDSLNFLLKINNLSHHYVKN